jgi:hypothetical protein
MEERVKGGRNRLAIFVIREARGVWVGVGVYTICELFFLAGELTYFH